MTRPWSSWGYSEIKHSNWLKKVTRLGTANQRALFQSSIATMLQRLLMTTAPVSIELITKTQIFLLTLNEYFSCSIPPKCTDGETWTIDLLCRTGHRSAKCLQLILTLIKTFFEKKSAIPGLFFAYFCFFQQTLQFVQQINVKNVYPVNRSGIWTYDLSIWVFSHNH